MGEQELFAGGIGQALLIINQVMGILFSRMTFSYYGISAIVYIVNDFIFLVFAILLAVSTVRATRRFGGSRVGTVAAVLGIFTGTMSIILDVFLSVYLASLGALYFMYVSLLLLIANAISAFIGLTMLVIGTFFIKYRKLLSRSGLWMSTGTVYIIAGALYLVSLTTILAPLLNVAATVTILAASMGVVCFFLTKAVTKKTMKTTSE